ncbi:hypothetical protein HOD08_02790 [bacterium]|nr:hypothetical protein [bacterium]
MGTTVLLIALTILLSNFSNAAKPPDIPHFKFLKIKAPDECKIFFHALWRGTQQGATFEEIEYFKEAVRLVQLDCSNLEIEELPQCIGSLVNLRILKLKRNRLQSLPKEIGNLKFLGHLNLSYNQLEELPCEVGRLENLIGLNVKNNKLETVPEEIGGLRLMALLNLANNNISHLPLSLGLLTNLRRVKLKGNPFGSKAQLQNLMKLLKR